MPEGLVRLRWQVHPAGYKLVQTDFPPGTAGASIYRGGFCITPLSKEPPRPYEAQLLQYEIFRDLANSAKRPGPEGVLEFVNKWGFLSSGSGDAHWRFLRDRDAFVAFVSDIQNRRSPPRLYGPGRNQNSVGGLDLCMETKQGRPRLFLQAQSLLDFCALEFYHATSGNADLTACDACEKILPLHKKGRPKRYCDDKCKMAAWRAEHRDTINRTRRQTRAKRGA